MKDLITVKIVIGSRIKMKKEIDEFEKIDDGFGELRKLLDWAIRKLKEIEKSW